jgi:hypothetical protein
MAGSMVGLAGQAARANILPDYYQRPLPAQSRDSLPNSSTSIGCALQLHICRMWKLAILVRVAGLIIRCLTAHMVPPGPDTSVQAPAAPIPSLSTVEHNVHSNSSVGHNQRAAPSVYLTGSAGGQSTVCLRRMLRAILPGSGCAPYAGDCSTGELRRIQTRRSGQEEPARQRQTRVIHAGRPGRRLVRKKAPRHEQKPRGPCHPLRPDCRLRYPRVRCQ